MAIWGNRDEEPEAEKAPDTAAPVPATPETGPPSGAAPGGGAPAAESAPLAGEPAPAPLVSESPAGTAAPDAPGSISPQRWSEILVAFVDDPRGSVKMAADAVDSAIEDVLASVRARQQALASSWQSGETDTEQLRIALREYRRFGAQVRQMSPAEPTRPGTAAAAG